MFHCNRSSTTPTPMPAMKATGRLTIPPISAARRARRSRSGLRTSVNALVWPGEASTAVTADKAPARVQATVDVRRTHTPDSRADSAFSAVARMASPHDDNLMKAARAITTMGATINVRTSPDEKRKVPMWNVQWMGTGKARYSFFGRMKGNTVKRNRTCDNPMVATMTMTRGRLNRRRRMSSDNAPAAAARPTAMTREIQ